MFVIRFVSSIAVLALTAASSFADGNSPVVNVNCGGSGDLQRAIGNAPAGTTLMVKGTCSKGPIS